MDGYRVVPMQIPYGSGMQSVRIPQAQLAGTCTPKALPALSDVTEALREQVRQGLDSQRTADKMQVGATACIAVTDRTRPTPNRFILPLLLNELNARGIRDDDITILIGLGMHAPDDPAAIQSNLGQEVLDRVTVLANEPDNANIMVSMGETRRGTPVELHRAFAEADIRLGTGNVTPCMLAGWSGGGKIVLPGVASRRTIYENHKRFTGVLAELACGSLIGVLPPQNVVRADIDEAATIGGIDMVVNTVLDRAGTTVGVFAGPHDEVHRAAVEHMRPYVEVSLPQKVDILLAGVGEASYECSLFQGGSRVCGGVDRYLNDGGTLILVNECREGIYEGFEHEQYRQWMREMPTPAEIRRLTDEMAIGGEKSCVLYTFSWLLHQKKVRIIVVTENMREAELADIHLGHATSAQEALDQTLGEYGSQATIGVIPYGALVLPVLAL